MTDMYYVAVGCSFSRIEHRIKDIENLYLANDNCPNQILMCGNVRSSDQLIEILKEEKIFYQRLEYQSGFHTPFLSNNELEVDEIIGKLELRQNDTPLWSATTLEQYPTTKNEFRDLTINHLTTTVRFRELIDKLYHQEQVKVFIQIGHGGLTGFVDDILKGNNYSIIPTSIENRTGIEQIRRVLALLFIEGKKIESPLLKIKISNPIGQRGVKLRTFLPILKDLPLLRKAAMNRTTSINIYPDDGLFDNPSDPVLLALKENMEELSSVQNEIIQLYKERSAQYKHRTPVQTSIQKKDELVKSEQPTDEEDFEIRLEDHLYLHDHTIVKQPDNWKYPEDLNPVIPMTMTIELLAEIANKRYPSRKVLSLESFYVFQWMGVEKPFKEKIKVQKKEDGVLYLEIKGYTNATVTMKDSFPEYNKPTIDLGSKILDKVPSKQELYEKFMFHGPGYQSVSEITDVFERGLKARVRKTAGKASLLDTLGQLIGLYLHLTQERDNVSFPTNVKRIMFYQDMHDQKGDFDFTLHVTKLTDQVISGDMIIERNGKVWCVAENWENRRIEIDINLWNGIRIPLSNLVGRRLKENVFYFDNAYSNTGSWGFLFRRYLNKLEREHYESLMLNRRREYLISRIALKDAVRSYISNGTGKYCYPIEIFVEHDTNGKPYVTGLDSLKGLEISLAHKGNDSVAIVSDKPVGIDLEKIEERSKEFMDISFTDHEKTLLEGRDLSEWTTRLWVAKEAYGKMKGTGLKGNPKQIEIKRIENETLFIDGVAINTIKHKDKFIVGWTL